MPGIFTKAHSFLRGCLGKDGRILLLLANDELLRKRTPHTIVVLWDNGRFRPIVTVEWWCCAAVFLDWPDAEFAVVGEQGQVLKVRADGSTSEEMLPVSASSQHCRWKAAVVIEGRLFAAGIGFCCAMVGPDGERRDLSPQRFGIATEEHEMGFEGLAGTSMTDIVAVGWGEIWCFDGERWEIQDSPVERILTDVISLPDGEFWICGQIGSLVRGRRGDWRALPLDRWKNLWSLAYYQGAVFVAAIDELRRFDLDTGEAEFVELEGNPHSFYQLDAKRGEVLLSTGEKNVVLVTPTQEYIID